jgi:hypothetical protein
MKSVMLRMTYSGLRGVGAAGDGIGGGFTGRQDETIHGQQHDDSR